MRSLRWSIGCVLGPVAVLLAVSCTTTTSPDAATPRCKANEVGYVEASRGACVSEPMDAFVRCSNLYSHELAASVWDNFFRSTEPGRGRRASLENESEAILAALTQYTHHEFISSARMGGIRECTVTYAEHTRAEGLEETAERLKTTAKRMPKGKTTKRGLGVRGLRLRRRP